MSPRSLKTVEKLCKKCTKEVKICITCSKCNNNYHPSCILKICGMFVDADGKIICCDSITSKTCQCEEKDLEITKLKTRLADLNEVCFEESMSRLQNAIDGEAKSACFNNRTSETNLVSVFDNINNDEFSKESEMKYLNMLIKEKDNMINELQDKILILKKYNFLMENSVNNRCAPSMDLRNDELPTEKIDQPVKHVDVQVSKKKTPLPASRDEGFIVAKKKTASKRAGNTSTMKNNDKRNLSSSSKMGVEGRSTRGKDNAVTGTDIDSSTFSGAPKRAWFYVGRVGENVKESQIEEHLKGKFPGQHFTIEKLPTRVETGSIAFKIGADISLLSDFYKPQNWPLGVVVKRFRFFRERSSKE